MIVNLFILEVFNKHVRIELIRYDKHPSYVSGKSFKIKG